MTDQPKEKVIMGFDHGSNDFVSVVFGRVVEGCIIIDDIRVNPTKEELAKWLRKVVPNRIKDPEST
ncbi:MAG: hypothetical protein ACR2QF_00955 [Geminicoccaceae bacterium]